MSDSAVIPATPQEAYDAGRLIGTGGGARLHDLTGQMTDLGIPAAFRGRWLAGVEDAYGEQGMTAPDEGDGHEWERRALAGAHARP